MFENILIPISSEYYSKDVLKRSVFLAEKFKSKITLIYIIEEKTLEQTDKVSDTYITHYEIDETKKEIVKKQINKADNVVFNDAKLFLKNKDIPFNEKIIKGEFSEIISNETHNEKYDLILMGFEKGCVLNYRLLDDVYIPIWIETGGENKSILAVCSNLAPNQKVPDVSIKLSKELGWDLHMLYVVDTEDNIQVDADGKRSDKKEERDLLFAGQNFVNEMKSKKIETELVKGNFEKETIKAAEQINANLVIIGREQKKKGILRMPVKNVKRKLAEKCTHSILFVK